MLTKKGKFDAHKALIVTRSHDVYNRQLGFGSSTQRFNLDFRDPYKGFLNVVHVSVCLVTGILHWRYKS